MRAAPLFSLALLLVGGCGGDDGSTPDSSASGDGTVEPPGLAHAEPPAPPVLTPCPDGWRAVALGDVEVCEPWPEGGMQACTANDEAHFPGDPGCTRVGTECPAGDWAADLPSDATIIYVRQGATGGNGTPAMPYGRLGEALRRTNRGFVVALNGGTFEEAVRMPDDNLTIWGACVAETLLTWPSSIDIDRTAVIVAPRPGAVIRNLRIEGETLGVWAAGPTATMHVEDVVIDGVRGMAYRTALGANGTARNVAFRNTRPYPAGSNGNGMAVFSGSRVEAERVVLSGNNQMGLMADGEDSFFQLTGVAMVETVLDLDRGFGHGFQAQVGAAGEITAGVIERNQKRGFEIDWPASLRFTHVVLRDSGEATPDERFGLGMYAGSGAMVEFDRSRVTGNRLYGLRIVGPDTTVRVTDSVLDRNEAQRTRNLGGFGAVAISGATTELTRVLSFENRDLGLMFISGRDATGPRTQVQLTDVRIADTQGTGSLGNTGAGLVVGAADVTVERLTVERSVATGVWMMVDARLTGTDLVVRDTQPDASGLSGNALNAVDDAEIQVDRVRIRGNHETGLAAFLGGTLDLQNAIVEGTRERLCGVRCASQRGGYGVLCFNDGFVTLRGFHVRDNDTAGFVIHQPCSVDLYDGTVSGTPIGVALPEAGYDLERLQNDVRYERNGTNFDSGAVPVPEVVFPAIADDPGEPM